MLLAHFDDCNEGINLGGLNSSPLPATDQLRPETVQFLGAVRQHQHIVVLFPV